MDKLRFQEIERVCEFTRLNYLVKHGIPREQKELVEKYKATGVFNVDDQIKMTILDVEATTYKRSLRIVGEELILHHQHSKIRLERASGMKFSARDTRQRKYGCWWG